MLELLTGMIVAIAAVALVLEPLIRRSPVRTSPIDDEEPIDLEESQSPKIRALLALREIEFDRETGKLSDQDYADLKEQYSQAALAAIEAEEQQGAAGRPEGDAAVDAAIQRMRRRRRDCPTCGIRPEKSAAFCSQCGRSLTDPLAQPRCWMCGTALAANARFCIECGIEVPDLVRPASQLRTAG